MGDDRRDKEMIGGYRRRRQERPGDDRETEGDDRKDQEMAGRQWETTEETRRWQGDRGRRHERQGDDRETEGEDQERQGVEEGDDRRDKEMTRRQRGDKEMTGKQWETIGETKR